MRIDAYNQITQVYGVKNKAKTAPTGKTSTTDKIEISSFGKELQIAKQAVANSSDVREDKVADIKARLANGTYHVDAATFADKLLESYNGIL
ncbi:MAG: flagellar biosynthesis anti-sigma factor FlgM [Lachnospiraceae bacterium]|nr:flagellar biosynthesis anti-sigma factor FlgM [Lachnospiraceae bacterium]